MCARLRYDMPGIRYDTPGLFYDGDPTSPRKMSDIKAIIDFSGYAAAELAPAAQTIHDKMTTNAATFGTPPVTMPALATLITAFNTKLAAKASRASGDPVIVDKSGFPSYETGQPADLSDLRLRHGDLSGEIAARYRPDRPRSMNEVQKCTDDPAVEANWQHAGMFGGGKATIGSLTPGALVWFRVRTCGLKGVMGA